MKKLIFSALCMSQLCLPLQSYANAESEAVDSLAQGCYFIKSPGTGKYVKQYHSGGIENDGENFAFYANSIDDANRFFFKPTMYKHFMITNRNGRYLSSRLPADPTAGKGPGRFSEWKITAVANGSYGYQYRLRGSGAGRDLRHHFVTDSFYFFDLLNPRNDNSEDLFELIPTTGCVEQPEMQVNVSGDIDALKGDVNVPVRGFIDPHTHITSYEFLGGKFMHGKPFHRWGVSRALNDSSGIHGPWGALDIIGNFYAQGDANFRYDTRGWPLFPYWPRYTDQSHMGYYYKWIERAYLGGLRIMVSHLVENQVLCRVQSTVNPASWINPNSCITMDSIRLQIKRLNEMQDYIDAQVGGPGKGFFRLVSSPQQAREVIADGKLAVVIGVEASETFNCGIQSKCTRHSIETQLQELHAAGIRSIFPAHKFDNLMSGSRVEDGLINAGNWLMSKHFFNTQECDSHTRGAHMKSGFPVVGEIPVLGKIIEGIAGSPEYDQSIKHCNEQGLTELGVYLVNRMIDMRMIIELDHASTKAAGEIMEIVEARGYSGVVSAHSWMDRNAEGGLHNNMERLAKSGGFITPYNTSTHTISGTISEYLNLVESTDYLDGVSFATDMSGLGNQAGPRPDAKENPLRYPFTTEFGLVFDRQVSGTRTIDYNNDGIAHFGMVADHLQDIREQAPARIYESVMNSAEAYLQMWERAEASTNDVYHNPLLLKVRIYNRASGKCIDVPGSNDKVSDGTPLIQWTCDHYSLAQQWIYDKEKGMLRNSVDPSLCMDSRNAANGGNIELRTCEENTDNSRWEYERYILRSKSDTNYTLDAGTNVRNGHRVLMWYGHGGHNQYWELRSEKDADVWTSYRTYMGNGCLELEGGKADNHTDIKMGACDNSKDELWLYEKKTGYLRNGLNPNKCMDVAASNTSNGRNVIIWDCNGQVNQQWDLDDGLFRSRLNSNKVIDTNSRSHGANIIIWDYHGRQNQRWRAVIQ